MILDRVQNLARYVALHEGLAAAARWVNETDLSALPPGRQWIDGERLYANVDHVEGKGREGARLEVHRAYIDIQIAVEGTDVIGWSPLSECRQPLTAFDEDKDGRLFADAPAMWFDLAPDTFAIFFPADAHAPLGGEGPVRKVIVKVRVEW